jgi:hypothetical protein
MKSQSVPTELRRTARVGLGAICVAASLATLPVWAADEPATEADPAAGSEEGTPAPAPATATPPAGAPAPAPPTPDVPVPPTVQPNPGILPLMIPAAGTPAPVPPGTPDATGMIPAPASPALPDAANFGGETDSFEVPIETQNRPSRESNPIDQMQMAAAGFGARPTGYSNPVGMGDYSMFDLFGESPLQGLAYSASLTGTYDSNPRLGYGGPNQTSDSDFFATLGGSISFRTKASALNFGASYSGNYNQYFNQSELSGYNQNGSLSASYDGGSLTARLNLGLSSNDGANRYYEASVQQYTYNYSLTASYRIGTKTSLDGNIGQTFTDSNGAYQSTGSFDSGLSAMWHYSDRTQFGPGIRYTTDSGQTDNFRTTIGPTITMNYLLTGKISLNSRIGLDFVQFDQGADDTSMSASIGLHYKASEKWGMSLSYYQDGQASPGYANGTQEIANLSLQYHRQILRATWNLGVTYEMGASGTNVNPNGSDVDSDYFSVTTGISMPVFNTASARLFMSWDQNGGGYSGTSGDDSRFQVGAGLTWSF